MAVTATNAILADPLVAAVRHHGGTFTTGPWTLHLPRLLGFCGGVLHALERLQQALAAAGGRHRFWLLGEIIHNETVNRFFADQGVVLVPDAEMGAVLDHVHAGDRVVIPAFGVPLAVEQTLRAAEQAGTIVLVDTACRYVRRIWDFVALQAAARRTLVLHGKPGHPEMRATLSRAVGPHNAVIVIQDESGARAVVAPLTGDARLTRPLTILQADRLDLHHLALVHQTTMMHDETVRIESILREAVSSTGADLQVLDTVCRATQERQFAAEELCRTGCDLFLVVGGYGSSNTSQLYRLAARHAPAYFVRDPAAVARDRIRHFLPEPGREEETVGWLPPSARIGILAGASCPPCDIGGVLRRFCDFAGRPPPVHPVWSG